MKCHKDLPVMVPQMDMFSSSSRTFMEPKMLEELGMSIYAVCLSRNLVSPIKCDEYVFCCNDNVN